jgi:hypothetical protein
VLQHAARLASDFLDVGRSEPMFDGAIPSAQMQALFARS